LLISDLFLPHVPISYGFIELIGYIGLDAQEVELGFSV